MAFATYNLDQVSLNLFGIPIVGGQGEGASIDLKFNSERYENTVGQRGDVVRSRTNDKSGTVEVTFLQTSKYNATLAAIDRLDDGTPNGAGVGPFQLRDRENGDLYVAAEAWIQKVPDVAFNRKASDRTWIIAFAECEYFPGGRP